MTENNQGEGGFYDSIGEIIKKDEESSLQNLGPDGAPKPEDKGPDPILSPSEVQAQLDLLTGKPAEPNPNPNPDPVKPVEDKDELWFLDPSKKVEPTDPSKEDWKAKYDELENKYKAVESDDLIKLHLKFKDTEGYSFDKLIESFAKPKEENLSLEDMLSKYLKTQGADDDRIEHELSLLDNKTTPERDALTAQLRELTKSNAAPTENEYLKVLEKQKESQNKYLADEAKRIEAAWKGADQFMESLAGKTIGSFEITKDVLGSVKESFNDANYYKTEDGNYNYQKQVMERFWGLHGPAIAKALVDKARAEFIDERSRPSAPGTGKSTVTAPPVDTRGKQDKDVEAYFKKENTTFTQ
jgi:hypothetical protein